MGRTPGHPWVGEAVALDFAAGNVTDYGDAIRYRDDSTAATLTAGQSFIAGFFDSAALLSGDDAVAWFVVDVAAGAGTVRLSTGVDPDWTLTDPADASDPGGDFTITGATTLAVAVPSFDVDTYLTQSQETIGRVECLSGSVSITQVRLRIWPPTGPVGGWKTGGSEFTIELPPNTYDVNGEGASASNTIPFVGGDPDVYEDASAATLSLWGLGSTRLIEQDRFAWAALPQVLVAYLDGTVDVQLTNLDPTFTAFGTIAAGASIAQQPDPLQVAKTNAPGAVGDWGTEVTWPPDVVPGDLGVILDGDPTVTWGEAVWDGGGILGVNADTAYYTLTVLPDTATVDPTGIEIPLHAERLLPSAPSPHPPQPVAMPDARTVMLSLSSIVLTFATTYGGPDPFEGASWTAGSLIEGFTITLGDSLVTVPSYRYWSPTAAVVEPLRLRQRSDGLGLGSNRVRGVGSRQMSVRVRGYL